MRLILKLHDAIKFQRYRQVKHLGDVPLIEHTVVLIVLVDALEQVVAVVEFLEPFEEEVLPDLPFFFSHKLLDSR